MKSNSIGSPKILLSRGVGSGGGSSSTGSIAFVDIFYIDASYDGTFTLTHTPISKTEHVVFNGQVMSPGIDEDYTILGRVITIDPAITALFVIDDKIIVFYNYR